jgi:hypothetical protein
VINNGKSKKSSLSLDSTSTETMMKNRGEILNETPNSQNEPVINPSFIAYISNISTTDETHPDFKYHQRPWNKEKSGVYAKLFNVFSPSEWSDFFMGNHPLNTLFPGNDFSSDFDASLIVDGLPERSSCNPKKQLIYPRTIIEPDVASVFSKNWLDTHASQLYESPSNIEYRIYLTILNSYITCIKKLEFIKLINGDFGIDRTQSEFSLSLKQRKVLEEFTFLTFFDSYSTIKRKEVKPVFLKEFWAGADFTLKIKSSEQVYWGLNATTALFQLVELAGRTILERWTDPIYQIPNSLFFRVSSVHYCLYDQIYSKYFKYGSTAYKLLSDIYGYLSSPSWIKFGKVASTALNSWLSLFSWHVMEKSFPRLLSTFNKFGIGKTAYGWIVIFLTISEILDAVELNQKREKVKKLFRDAYNSGYIEGPYVQSGGNIRIKKTVDGQLPVAYDSDGNPISYHKVQSETIKNQESRIIKSYDELMGPIGESIFWKHLRCEDARVLKSIIEKDRKLFPIPYCT